MTTASRTFADVNFSGEMLLPTQNHSVLGHHSWAAVGTPAACCPARVEGWALPSSSPSPLLGQCRFSTACDSGDQCRPQQPEAPAGWCPCSMSQPAAGSAFPRALQAGAGAVAGCSPFLPCCQELHFGS